MQGLSLDLYFKYTGQTLDNLREQMRPQAESQVKTRLALEKIVELEGIVASDEDINAEYERLASAYGMELDKVKEFVRPEDIAKDMAVQKAMEFVKSNAVIKEAECNCNEASEEAPAKKKTTTRKKKAPAKAAETTEESPAEEAGATDNN